MNIVIFGLGFWGKEFYCFVDKSKVNVLAFADNNTSLAGTMYEGIQVLSPAAACELQYDYIIITTQNDTFINEIKNQLLGLRVDEKKMIPLYGNEGGYNNDILLELLNDQYESRLGCHLFGYHFIFTGNRIMFCCVGAMFSKYITIEDEIITEDTLRRYITIWVNTLEEHLEKLRQGIPNRCYGCPHLAQGIYSKKPIVRQILFGGGFKGAVCNASCIYCSQFKANCYKINTTLDGHDILRIADEYFTETITHVGIVDAEISVLPHRERLLDLVLEKNWDANICSNAIIYNEKVAEILKRQNSAFNVSLDSGTAETYHKIKQVNVFDKVVANLEKYKSEGARIFLKYILLDGINDNFDDINGFIDIAKKIGVYQILLSFDPYDVVNYVEGKEEKSHDLSEHLYAMMCYFAARCKEENISCANVSESFTAKDKARMDILCGAIVG